MNTREYFFALTERLAAGMKADEHFTCWFSGESSDFVRFNHAAVRQAGSVKQGFLRASLIQGQKQSVFTMGICEDIEKDGEALERLLNEQRVKMEFIPDDPYLLISTVPHSSDSVEESQLSDPRQVVEYTLAMAQGLDLVGIYAGGTIYRGFANSFGQKNWLTKHNFNLDFSVYLRADKAVKASYAGFVFDPLHFERELTLVKEKLRALEQPSRDLSPGKYRAYLTPAALHDLVSMLGWGGLSEKALRTKQSSLNKMRDEGKTLSALFSLYEHTGKGTGPLFQAQGFIKPDCVSLIKEGELVGSLISPRTAKEYGTHTNGADGSETPEAYDVAPGNLPREDVLKALGTGIYIGNLWYLNYSDRQSARITGMTRFATFWVEDGQIVAPLNVMRFDDSLYALLGENLEALTKECDFMLDPSTYEERSTGSAHLPGAIINNFNLTL
ncbi:MAG: metallopeptidase TldD-related protein [Myxococcota bacterium]